MRLGLRLVINISWKILSFWLKSTYIFQFIAWTIYSLNLWLFFFNILATSRRILLFLKAYPLFVRLVLQPYNVLMCQLLCTKNRLCHRHPTWWYSVGMETLIRKLILLSFISQIYFHVNLLLSLLSWLVHWLCFTCETTFASRIDLFASDFRYKQVPPLGRCCILPWRPIYTEAESTSSLLFLAHHITMFDDGFYLLYSRIWDPLPYRFQFRCRCSNCSVLGLTKPHFESNLNTFPLFAKN